MSRAAWCSDLEDDASRRVARRLVHAEAQLSHVELLTRRELAVRRRLRLDAKAEHQPLLHDGVVQKAIGGMQVDGQRAERLPHRAHARDVVDVRVGQQNRRQVQAIRTHTRDQRSGALAGIDGDRLAGLSTHEEQRVLVERRGGKRLQTHCSEFRVQGHRVRGPAAIIFLCLLPWPTSSALANGSPTTCW